MNSNSHWEPPLRKPLLITVHKLADILDVPLWKAYEISGVLDCRYYSKERRHYRVTMKSVEVYLDLLEADLPAREIMGERKRYGRSLIEDWGLTPRSANHLRRRSKRSAL